MKIVSHPFSDFEGGAISISSTVQFPKFTVARLEHQQVSNLIQTRAAIIPNSCGGRVVGQQRSIARE